MLPWASSWLRGSALAPACLASACLVFGCADAPSAAEVPAAIKLKPESGGVRIERDSWSSVPVPPADGPTLHPLKLATKVLAKPVRDAETVGVLRVGARVPRSAEPVSLRDCAGGWYAVRPFGFVCAGTDATLKSDHPVVRAIQAEPDRNKPMPYKYAFLRGVSPNYMRIPTREEQFKHEFRLERHLRNWQRLREKWDALEVGANDVPLDERGFALGAIPDHAKPMDESERYGGNGDDRIPWWLQGERRIPNLSMFRTPSYAVIGGRVKRHAGVALIGTFVAGPEAQSRRFAITTDARLLPADKLKADSGSPFHGVDIRKIGLPVAFARELKAKFYRFERESMREAEPVGWREFVPLTGLVKIVDEKRFVETRDGRWLRSDHLKTVVKPGSLPGWARKGAKWIDLSLLNQTLTLWEGDAPVYVTLVSTGRDGLGEPGETLSTPQGYFRIYQKHITTTMDSEVADHEFELRDVPWVMYFKGGYALHGAYWHDDFGRPRSHGCVNLAPIDARVVFNWATPGVPEHWHAAYAGQSSEPGTLISIHP